MILCALSVFADISIEPKVPDITELPPPTDLYYPEYSYGEISASTLGDLSVYFSFLDGLSLIKIFGLCGGKERRFIDMDFKRNPFKLKSGSMAFDFSLKHSSDTSSGTALIPSIEYDNFIGRGILFATASFVYFHEAARFNNLSKFSYIISEENFNWGVLSNWQRTERAGNSHIGVFIEKENIRYGIFYAKSLFPFLHIKADELNPLKFTLIVDGVRQPMLDEEELFSSSRTNAYNLVCRSRYFGYAEIDYYSLKVKGRIFSDIDDIETYKDMGNLYYEFSLSQNGSLNKLFYDASLSVRRNEYSKNSFCKFLAFYETGDVRTVASYKICEYDRDLSHILNGFFSIGTSGRRISFGVRNILSQYDCEEDLYSPVRTYFMNIIFIHSSLFGKPK